MKSTRSMRRLSVKRLSVAVAVIGVLGSGACGRHTASAVKVHNDSSTCQEDEPCWNWQTMGNHERGICVTDTGSGDQDMIERADGSTYPGGRGCEATYEKKGPATACADAMFALHARNLAIPVGWSLECKAWPQVRGLGTLEYNGVPARGLTTPSEKLIQVDAGVEHTDQELQGVVAHEVCHAQEHVAHTNLADYVANEQLADACARAHGFYPPSHGL